MTMKVVGEETIQGYDCYKIEMTPKPEAPVVWTRVDVWISKEEYIELKAEFYDEFGDLINVMNGMNVKEFDGRLIPSRMEMIPMDKEGHMTVLEYKSMEFNEGIPESFFSVQNMRRVQ
ncbi:MAG: outer membrane lipoprotein-sorting protein [Gracilimonas sp.]|nr:outer membrane lipoprotein-sorting protein [Gracilimonas sp.]